MSKEQKEKFEIFWQKFIDKHGFPSYPNYEEVADFWIHETETVLETLIDNCDCPYEKGKLKEYLMEYS